MVTSAPALIATRPPLSVSSNTVVAVSATVCPNTTSELAPTLSTGPRIRRLMVMLFAVATFVPLRSPKLAACTSATMPSLRSVPRWFAPSSSVIVFAASALVSS
jgi:hypothetical protein